MVLICILIKKKKKIGLLRDKRVCLDRMHKEEGKKISHTYVVPNRTSLVTIEILCSN